MPNSVWTGSLSLGLVVGPVRLYPAVRKKNVRFHELDRAGRRVRHVRVPDPDIYLPVPEPESHVAITATQERRLPEEPIPTAEVTYEEIQKGYEVAPGEYVSMTREEVASLAPERSRVIDVQQFVDVSAVDPIYFESRYYVVPDRESASPLRVLWQTLAPAHRIGLG